MRSGENGSGKHPVLVHCVSFSRIDVVSDSAAGGGTARAQRAAHLPTLHINSAVGGASAADECDERLVAATDHNRLNLFYLS